MAAIRGRVKTGIVMFVVLLLLILFLLFFFVLDFSTPLFIFLMILFVAIVLKCKITTFQAEDSLKVSLPYDKCYSLVLKIVEENFKLISNKKKLGRIECKGSFGWTYPPKILFKVDKIKKSSSQINIKATASGVGLLSPNTAKRSIDKFLEKFNKQVQLKQIKSLEKEN